MLAHSFLSNNGTKSVFFFAWQQNGLSSQIPEFAYYLGEKEM